MKRTKFEDARQTSARWFILSVDFFRQFRLCFARSTAGHPDFQKLSFPGKGCREMNPDFPRELSYPSSDLYDFETDGIELGRGPLRSF